MSPLAPLRWFRLRWPDAAVAATTCRRMSAAGDDTVPLGPLAPSLVRGVGRALREVGYVSLSEFTLRSRRRVDVIALNRTGIIAIVEVKSTLEDFRADHKWRDYRAYCDRFYFAVPPDFPRQVLPEDCGLWVADAYGATLPPRSTATTAQRRPAAVANPPLCADRGTAPDPPERNSQEYVPAKNLV